MARRFGTVFLLATFCSGAADKLTYNTLAALMQDLRYNEVRREQLVTEDPEGKSGVLLTIRNVRVQSVGRNPQWKGVIVVTYGVLKGNLLLAAVYVDMVPAAKMADIHHDDRVSIVGYAFSYEPPSVGGSPTEVIRLYGVVVPE